MPTQRKIDSVEDLTEKMSRTQMTLVTDYRGLTVAEITDLRKKLSAFASPGSLAGERELPAPCGSCGHPDGPGACRFQ
jgi:hypothetical protein